MQQPVPPTPKTDSELFRSMESSLRSIKNSLTFFVVVTILAIIINVLF